MGKTQPTSTASYYELVHIRKTQEAELFRLLKASPLGLTDRQIGDALGLPCNLAAARRNGVIKRLAWTGAGQTIRKCGTVRDSLTGKRVSVWALADLPGLQSTLF